MTLEVLLSTMNLNTSDLDKMNIHIPCIVINQCGRQGYREYKNFKIYDTNEKGVSKSRNMAIEKSSADILLFADNDCVYNDNFDKIIIDFYQKHNADMVFFNMNIYDNSIKQDKKIKKIHFYNYQKYGACRTSFKRISVLQNNIKLCNFFGGNSLYSHGEDTIFIHDFIKNKQVLYTSNKYIGIIKENVNGSTWFKGYTDKFFFDKGALFSALSPNFKYFQCIQYLIRHRETLKNRKFIKTLLIMFEGVKDYGKNINNNPNL